MTKFRVTLMHDACTTHDVEADTQDAATVRAFEEVSVSLCHQCSSQVDLGDPIRAVIIENLDTDEVDTDPDPDPEVLALRREVRYLRHYGNKDCTRMADEAMARNELED
jgi:hypothetical protein